MQSGCRTQLLLSEDTMKRSLIAAAMLTCAIGSSAVMAQTIGNTTQTIDLTSGSNFFGDRFAADNDGARFTDRFNFNVTGSANQRLDAIISSISSSAGTGLALTGLSLYDAATRNNLVATGTAAQSGAADVWTITANNLAAGSYYLQVSGNLVSADAASFGGAAALTTPVPEPETYGMMLAGLGIVGALARRRKAGHA
jgi:hypothetical protein